MALFPLSPDMPTATSFPSQVKPFTLKLNFSPPTNLVFFCFQTYKAELLRTFGLSLRTGLATEWSAPAVRNVRCLRAAGRVARRRMSPGCAPRPRLRPRTAWSLPRSAAGCPAANPLLGGCDGGELRVRAAVASFGPGTRFRAAQLLGDPRCSGTVSGRRNGRLKATPVAAGEGRRGTRPSAVRRLCRPS